MTVLKDPPMTVTRHPMFLESDPKMGGVPIDRLLAQRLRTSYAVLPHRELSRRFLSFLSIIPERPLVLSVEQTERLAAELDYALAGLIEGLDAPAEVRNNLRSFGVELRRHGLGRDDRPRLVGTMMAALVDVAGHRWRLETVVEWAEAVSVLFDAALGRLDSDPASNGMN